MDAAQWVKDLPRVQESLGEKKTVLQKFANQFGGIGKVRLDAGLAREKTTITYKTPSSIDIAWDRRERVLSWFHPYLATWVTPAL